MITVQHRIVRSYQLYMTRIRTYYSTLSFSSFLVVVVENVSVRILIPLQVHPPFDC